MVSTYSKVWPGVQPGFQGGAHQRAGGRKANGNGSLGMPSLRPRGWLRRGWLYTVDANPSSDQELFATTCV